MVSFSVPEAGNNPLFRVYIRCFVVTQALFLRKSSQGRNGNKTLHFILHDPNRELHDCKLCQIYDL